MAESTGCIYDEVRGYACHTWTGKALYPADIRREDVDIRDIAHGLSLICRYQGQCDDFYSVAQHSYHIWELASPKNKREALLHDAPEYITGDFARPHKMQFPELVTYEKPIEFKLNTILGIPPSKSPEVGYLDNLMLATEMPFMFQRHGSYQVVNGVRTFMGKAHIMAGLPEPLPWTEFPLWSPKEAEAKFLEAYYSLED